MQNYVIIFLNIIFMKLSTEVGGKKAGLVLLTHFSDIVEVLVWIK